MAALAADLGLDRPRYRGKGPDKGWSCETEKLLTYTDRSTALENATNTPAAYRIYSASAHAEWHAIVAGWRQVEMSEGPRSILVRRPDRVAVWGSVFAASSFAVEPARRALELLGRRARLRDCSHWAQNSLQLMRRMDLPREWWAD